MLNVKLLKKEFVKKPCVCDERLVANTLLMLLECSTKPRNTHDEVLVAKTLLSFACHNDDNKQDLTENKANSSEVEIANDNDADKSVALASQVGLIH